MQLRMKLDNLKMAARAFMHISRVNNKYETRLDYQNTGLEI